MSNPSVWRAAACALIALTVAPTRAADHLAVRGYITNADRTALIAAAEREPLPEELQCRK